MKFLQTEEAAQANTASLQSTTTRSTLGAVKRKRNHKTNKAVKAPSQIYNSQTKVQDWLLQTQCSQALLSRARNVDIPVIMVIVQRSMVHARYANRKVISNLSALAIQLKRPT